MKHKIDLHMHTNHSDGSLSPSELVMLAKEKGLKAIAVTDHDTVSGLKECISCSSGFGVDVIPGAEIGIKNEEERKLTDIHILGYFIDCENRNLLSVLKKINGAKRTWLAKQIKKLNETGLEISAEEVKIMAGLAVPSRPHVWKAVERHGNKISRDDFFSRTKTGGDLFVRKDFELPLEDCIRLIHEAGGLAVFAHPGFHDFENVVSPCIDAGIDGLEVKYFYGFGKDEDAKVVGRIDELAEEHKLLKTGGSDFHDRNRGADLGSVSVPCEWLEKMKERANIYL
ncbi:MAG: PHP domain-containing protein [Nanoarchaeota archaeon]|nr:PHP domain-containing protein [Nanoarchaeota archaeon]